MRSGAGISTLTNYASQEKGALVAALEKADTSEKKTALLVLLYGVEDSQLHAPARRP